MDNDVMTGSFEESSTAEPELYSGFRFIGEKHKQAMVAAQELLSEDQLSGTGINESLNCGKLAQLIAYIKNGSAFVLIGVTCYAEAILA